MSSTEAPEHPDKIDAAVLKIAGVVVLGAIMSILDITVVNVALPTFQTELDVENYSTVAWTVTAYTLALGGSDPDDRVGRRPVRHQAALHGRDRACSRLGSVLCATAWSIEALIGFRVLQGLGGGMLMPLGMTIMTRAAGPERMGRLMAILGVPMLLGPILGPIIGGWLIDNASWHWIFLINLPIGIGALVYAYVVLPQDSPEPSESFDFLGMAMLSPGLALFLYGVSSIPDEGTVTAPKVWVTMLIGGLLVIGFVFYSFKPRAPAARPAAVQELQPVDLDVHHVHVRRGVLRRPAAGADLLPAGPRREPARCRTAGRTAGHRRDDHDADRRRAGRQDPGRPDRAGRPVRDRRSRCSGLTQIEADTSYALADRGPVRDGSRDGRHHDAADDVGAADARSTPRSRAGRRCSTSPSRSPARSVSRSSRWC